MGFRNGQLPAFGGDQRENFHVLSGRFCGPLGFRCGRVEREADMRWRKLGMVFDLSKHSLPGGSIGFAQSPQPVVFDNFVRVYFSTRAVDPKNGKFISDVAFVDFAPDFSEV